MIHILIALGLIIATIWAKVYIDKRKLKKDKKIRHLIEWFCMAIANITAIYLLSSQSTIAPYFHFSVFDLSITLPLKVTIISTMVAFFILCFFNGWFNISRDQKWFFTGTLHKGTAKTDLILKWFEKRAGWVGVALIEFIPLIALVWYYLKNLK